MRKSLFFAGLAAAALTLVGCNKEADFAGNGRKVEIVLSDVATRTVNYGMSTEWKSGDELSVFTAPTGTTNWSSNIKFTVQDASANRAAGEAELTDDAYDWYAFYPYTSQIPNPTTLNPEGSSHERSGYVTVGGQAQVQRADDNKEHLAGTKVPVFGSVKNVPADEMPVIEMKNAASVACFKVTNALEEAIRILSVKFTAPEDIVGTYYIDFSGTAPAFVASGDTYVYDNVTVTNSDPSSIAPDSNGEFYAVIKPFTAAAGAKLTVEVEAESADGAKKATATKEVTLTAATEFKPGFIKTLNIPFDVALEETLPQELPYSEAFKGVGIGAFSIDNVSLPSQLSYVWTYDSRYGMKASAFVNGTAYLTESWLVSPLIDLTSAAVPQLSFKHAVNQFTSVAKAKEEATVWARVKGGEWTKLDVNYPTDLSWTFVNSGAVDLSAYKGEIVQIGFKYTSTADKAGTWEIQEFLVQDSVEPEFGVEQTSFEVAANVTSVTVNVTGNVAWTVQDASEGVAANPDSGSGAGTIAVTFPANTDPTEKFYSLKVVTDNAQLVASSDEEFVIDITQAAASTEPKGFPFEWGFTEAQGQGDFTIDDVNKPAALDYVWSFDTRGFMKASAFKSNTNYDAESWLISPVVDLAAAQNPTLTFAHATNYFTSVAKAQEETSVWVREEGGAWAAIEGVNYPTSLGWTFADSGSLDLSAYKGKKVQIGFKYTSTSTKSGTWEIQNFKLAEASVGPVEPGVTTVSTTMEAYAKEHECTISENTTVVNYKTLELDDVVTMSTTGEGNCGSFWYATGTQWRLYQNKSGNVVVSLASGYKLKSVSFVYEVTNTATLKDSKGAVVASGDVYETDASTVEFTVGNTASATNGQVRIKEVTIKYEEGQGTTPTLVDPTIEVSPTLSVVKGETATIAVTTNSNGAKTWSSSDETVATVDNNGVVTGVKAGTATVTLSIAATSSYNAGSAEVAVTVTEPVTDGNTVSMTMTDYVTEHGCEISSGNDNIHIYKTLQLNPSVRMSTTGEPNCGAFYGASTQEWRLYQNKDGNVIITVANGCELKSVKLTYGTSNNGTLVDGAGNAVASNAVQTVSGSSVTYTVGNKADATNGQVKITAVEVKYTGDGTTFPDNPDPQPTEIETKITMPNNANVYVGETVALNATSNVEGATITYESEDPAIATVNASGVVTGVAEGSVKVWARIAGVAGSYTSAEHYCTVTVATKPVQTDGTEVFIFSELGYANQADVTTVKGNNVTLVFDKGEGTNAPKYYTNGTNVRMYKNNTLTISSEKTITKIEFFCTDGYGIHNEATFSTGTCSNDVWEGSAKSVELVNATSGTTQIRFTSIKVTYE